MEPILTYRGTVYPWHCDHMGHMNTMWYAGKFDEAGWNFLVQIGMTPAYLRTTNRGMAAVEQLTRYIRELKAGDSVEVRTSLTEVRERAILFTHTMINVETGETHATCDITAVHFDRVSRRATPLEDLQRRMAKDLLATAAAGRKALA